jgi:hypothetical protein
MIYFCQRKATPQTSAEVEQWQRVLQFREELPQEQLWWPYRRTAEFERLVRAHLVDFVLRRVGRSDVRGIGADDGASVDAPRYPRGVGGRDLLERVDFFVSYVTSDRPWAQWIAWVLEAAGYSVLIQVWDFGPVQISYWRWIALRGSATGQSRCSLRRSWSRSTWPWSGRQRFARIQTAGRTRSCRSASESARSADAKWRDRFLVLLAPFRHDVEVYAVQREARVEGGARSSSTLSTKQG